MSKAPKKISILSLVSEKTKQSSNKNVLYGDDKGMHKLHNFERDAKWTISISI